MPLFEEEGTSDNYSFEASHHRGVDDPEATKDEENLVWR